MNVTTWLRIKMNLEPQQKGYCYEVKICTKQNGYCKMDPKYALSIFWDFLCHARQPYISPYRFWGRIGPHRPFFHVLIKK